MYCKKFDKKRERERETSMRGNKIKASVVNARVEAVLILEKII